MSHEAADPIRTFVDRWKGRALTERAAAQAHFIDLCDLLGVPRPTDQRETDSTYGFEARTEIISWRHSRLTTAASTGFN